jgi:hypothetical protein
MDTTLQATEDKSVRILFFLVAMSIQLPSQIFCSLSQRCKSAFTLVEEMHVVNVT